MAIRIRQAPADQRGFTLTELLVAIALLGLIMAGTLTVLMVGNESYLTGSNQAEAQAAVRAALERMTTDIREAGYDPEATGCTTGGAGCWAALNNPTTTSFEIQNNWNGSLCGSPCNVSPIQIGIQVPVTYCDRGAGLPVLPCTDAAFPVPNVVNRGERITYSIAGNNLTRQESFVDAQPQTLATGVQLAGVGQNCAGAQVANPDYFQYCDGAGLAAANAWQVREVILNMQVGVQRAPPSVWQFGAVQVTMSHRIRLRNR